MKKGLLLCYLLAANLLIWAQAGGRYTNEFLNLKLSPVISALQGANIAQLSADPSVLVRNPALLNEKMKNRLNVSYNNYIKDINFGNLGYVFEIKGQAIHAGMLYINYGQFDGYDETGQSTGKFSVNNYAFYTGTAKKLTDRLTLGGNFKFIYNQSESYFSSGMALDAGLHYKDSSGNTNMGFVIRNAGVTLKNYTKNIKEGMPLNIEFSYSKKLEHTPFRFNLLLHNLQQLDMRYVRRDGASQNTSLDASALPKKISIGDNALRHLSLGTELLLGEFTHLRLGYNHQMRRELSPENRKKLTGFAWGFGIELYKIHVNYASSAFFPGITTNQFSIVFNIATIYTKKSNINKSEQ